jgi:hypothetical protein
MDRKLPVKRDRINILKWFQNYLYGREQRIVINGSNSNLLPIRVGFLKVPFLALFYLGFTP